LNAEYAGPHVRPFFFEKIAVIRPFFKEKIAVIRPFFKEKID